ncbi:carboxymuconolactone decarboxylase family protein [Alcaligenes faecalis]|uniref:carboxymuconolactone decarboxylase family protein n=1 Tax=Alcaligenes faecalis TaxID=511 RepID=UPI0029321C8D|nr:carboxymuconolactone decarboxylase family protein [Alcaligenes faecalis]MDV2117436.1 carboxymuconolactone decarboxylase family protein [Alcaligenes faecalis]
MSETRLNPSALSPNIYKTIVKYDAQIYSETTLNKELIELVKVRISQLNGCAFCIDVHSKHALSLGISERKLLLLNAWKEAPLFTEQEQAALRWAEQVTFIQNLEDKQTHLQELKAHFNDKEIVDLTYLIGLVNVWNRLAISMNYEISR